MKRLSSISAMQKLSVSWRKKGETIAFVPTMGFLHKGHLSLLKIAKKKARRVVISIFVNPTQFGPNEDFSTYPRNLERDIQLVKELGVDAVFLPSEKNYYPDGFQTFVDLAHMTQALCGVRRPGHFKGVTTIVTKLFNTVMPDVAIFGKKDYQQFCVIKQMTKDLNLPIKIVGAPIIREKDGLAMSSRNVYLSEQERISALSLYQSLKLAKTLIDGGSKNTKPIVNSMKKLINKHPSVKIDYVECLDADSLIPLTTLKPKKTLFALAVFVGKTRLIDNMVL